MNPSTSCKNRVHPIFTFQATETLSLWPEKSKNKRRTRLKSAASLITRRSQVQVLSPQPPSTLKRRFQRAFSLLSEPILKILKFAPKLTPKRARPALFPRIPPFWLKKPEPCPNCMVHRQGPALLQTPVAAVPKGALLKKLAQLIGHYKAVAPAAGPAAAWSASWTCAGGAVRRLCSGSAEWSA